MAAQEAGQVIEYIERYLLHDPIGNTEAEIAEFDTQKLQAAEDRGAIFIAVYSTGERKVVKAADIDEPLPRMHGIQLVAPAYVDDRMVAVADVFDALAFEMSGGVSLMSVDDSGAASPPTFAEALAKLKELIADGNSGR